MKVKKKEVNRVCTVYGGQKIRNWKQKGNFI